MTTAFFRPLALSSLLLAPLAAAQDIPPAVQADLEKFLGTSAAMDVIVSRENLGKAFLPDLAVKIYKDTLTADKPEDEPNTSDCPMTAATASAHIRKFSGDYRADKVLNHMDKVLAMGKEELEKYLKDEEELYKRLSKGYRPILKARERMQEADMVRLHATQPGVETLSNGILVSIATPGSANIRDITRGTTETGVSYYTRVTNDMDFDQLPETVRLVADEIPAATA